MITDLLATYLVLASGIVANRYLLAGKYITVPVLVGLRMTISGLLILLYSGRTSHRLRWSYMKDDARRIVTIAIVATLLPAALKAAALGAMPAAKQTLLGSIDPFVTAVYAYLLWGDVITPRKLLGMIIGFVGITVAVVGHSPEDVLWSSFLWISWPELASFASVSVSRYGWILVQDVMRSERYRPHEITAISMVIAGTLSLLYAAVAMTQGWITESLWTLFQEGSWSVLSVLAYSIFIGNIIGYTMYSYALKRHHATTVALTGLSMPLLVASLEWLLGLGAPTSTFGIAIALLGVGFAIFFTGDRHS